MLSTQMELALMKMKRNIISVIRVIFQYLSDTITVRACQDGKI